MNKREVVQMVQAYQIAVEKTELGSSHPLAVLADTHGGTEHTPPGSRPLIKDYLPRAERLVGAVLGHIYKINPQYCNVLQVYADIDSLAKTGKALNMSKPAVKSHLDCGIAMFQASWTFRNLL